MSLQQWQPSHTLGNLYSAHFLWCIYLFLTRLQKTELHHCNLHCFGAQHRTLHPSGWNTHGFFALCWIIYTGTAHLLWDKRGTLCVLCMLCTFWGIMGLGRASPGSNEKDKFDKKMLHLGRSEKSFQISVIEQARTNAEKHDTHTDSHT